MAGEAEHSGPKAAGRRRPLATAVLAAALVAAGSAVWLAAPAQDEGSTRVIGGNRPVNKGATDPIDLTSHNSPALRANPANPAHLAVANRIDSPSSSCALHVSLDGGSTWVERPLALPEGRPIPCIAPDVAFGADGTLYVAFTSFGPVEGSGTVPDAVWLITSRDQGRTLSAPARVAGPLAFQLRLAADPARPGRLYLAWLQGSGTSSWGFASDGNPIVVSRSDDGGTTWAPPVKVSPAGRRRVVAPSVAVTSSGGLAVAYLDVGDDRLDYHGGHEGKGGEPYPGHWSLLVATSSDGGKRWREAVVDARVVPTQRFLMFFPPAPSVAVGPGDDTVYVGFHDGRLGDADVWVWASPDGGRRWKAPTRVNDTRPRDGRAQYLPQLDVTPDGRLDVVYYDRRDDAENVRNTVSLQSSFDRARTFRPSVRVSDGPFDSGVGFGSDRELPDLGDRLGVVATETGALAMWTDTRAGLRETGKQDLASAVASVTAPERAFPGLRIAGAVLVVAGLALAGRGLLSWRREKRGRSGAEPANATEGASESAHGVLS